MNRNTVTLATAGVLTLAATALKPDMGMKASERYAHVAADPTLEGLSSLLYLIAGAAFILACGSTHLLDAITFWFPAYRLNALVRFITGVVSWTTVFYMVRIMPEAMRLKTTEELEYEVQERRKVEWRFV